MSVTEQHARSARWMPVGALLLVYVSTRLLRLDSMPPHIDEVFHVMRARDVWALNPLYFAITTKLLNVWLIALFYPFANGIWTARIVSVFSGMVAAAGAYKLGDLLYGRVAGLIGGLLYVAMPLAFWHDRIAISDTVANATGVMVVLTGVLLARRPARGYALLVGASLAAATLSKLTMLFFWPMPLLAWLLLRPGRFSRGDLSSLATAYGSGVLLVAPIATYAVLNYGIGGQIAYSAGGLGSGSLLDSLSANLAHLYDAARTLVGLPALVWLAGALVIALAARFRPGLYLTVAASLPLGVLLLVGQRLYTHYYLVVLPPLLVLMGTGASLAWRWLHRRLPRRPVTWAGVLLLGVLVASWTPFFLTTYTNVTATALPAQDQRAYVSSHTSGYGWDVAATWLSGQAAQSGRSVEVVGPVEGHAQRMQIALTDVPGIEVFYPEPLTANWLSEHVGPDTEVYVVRDDMSYAPRPPFDWDALGVAAQRVGMYPKPGDQSWVEVYRLSPLEGESSREDS